MPEIYEVPDRQNLGFARWYGKTKKAETRFHHHVAAPAGLLRDMRIEAPVADSYFSHQLFAQSWTVANAKDGRIQAYIELVEEVSVLAAHLGLTGRLECIASAAVDRMPVAGGPGDVTAAWHMVRDNVRVDGKAEDRTDEPLYAAYAAVDEYLLSNWPHETAQSRPGPLEPLKITLAIASTVKKGAPAELRVSVTRNGQELPLKDLSFRVLMEPGRLRWDDGKLFYSSENSGPAKITLDAFAEPNAYGQGSATIVVED